jgi:hypothetical protein
LAEVTVTPNGSDVKGKARAIQPPDNSVDDGAASFNVEVPPSVSHPVEYSLPGSDTVPLRDDLDDRPSELVPLIQLSDNQSAGLKTPSCVDEATKCLEDFDLTGRVIKTSPHAVECGGFADVYQGLYEGQLVAIKAPRLVNVTVRKLAKVSNTFRFLLTAKATFNQYTVLFAGGLP